MKKPKMKNNLHAWSIAVLLVAVIVSLLLACVGCSDDENGQSGENIRETSGYRFGFIGDLHTLSEDMLEDDDCPAFQAYTYNGQRIIPLASAIFKTAVDQYIEDDVDAVFICGELSENGSYISLLDVAEQCKRLENAGIPTFVCNGSDDIFNTPFSYSYAGSRVAQYCSPSQFRDIFADFGYNEALVQDEETLSYVCDVPGTNVRLMNVSVDYYVHRDPSRFEESVEKPVLTDRMLEWIEENLIQAQQDGKEVIVMSYFPVSDVLGEAAGLVLTNYALSLENSDLALYLFAQYGVKYVLSGHMHVNSAGVFYDEFTGNTVTNLTVGCLSNYPMGLTYLDFDGENWSYFYKNITSIKEEYVPSYCSEEIKEAVTSDLHAYAKSYLKVSLHKELQTIIDRQGVENGLIIHWLRSTELYDIDNPSQASLDLVDLIYGIYTKFIDLPLYGEDSIQSRVLTYGIVMPEDEKYADFTFSDLLIHLFCTIYDGTADLGPDSYDTQFIIDAVYALLDIIADADVFSYVQKIIPSTVLFDLHPTIDKMAREGILDLKTDDFLLKIASVFSPIIESKTGLKIDFLNADVDAILDAAKLIMRPALVIILQEDFDAENNTIYGYNLSDYIDFDKGYIYTRKLFSEVFFQLFAGAILSQDGDD